jgi:hypothetical protein
MLDELAPGRYDELMALHRRAEQQARHSLGSRRDDVDTGTGTGGPVRSETTEST